MQRIPDGDDIGEMLARGDIDALICPQRPEKTNQALAAAGDGVTRLFSDPVSGAEAHPHSTGFITVGRRPRRTRAALRALATRVVMMVMENLPGWLSASSR